MPFTKYRDIAQKPNSNTCGAFALAAALESQGFGEGYTFKHLNLGTLDAYDKDAPMQPAQYAEFLYAGTGNLVLGQNQNPMATYTYDLNVNQKEGPMNSPSALAYMASYASKVGLTIEVNVFPFAEGFFSKFTVLNTTNQNPKNFYERESALIGNIPCHGGGSASVSTVTAYSQTTLQTEAQLLLVGPDNSTAKPNHWIAVDYQGGYDPGKGIIGTFSYTPQPQPQPQPPGKIVITGVNQTVNYEFYGLWISLKKP